MLITAAIISGIGLGSMYGLIALGYHVTYVVSNTVNFSQGSAMMLGAVLGYTFGVRYGWPLPLAIAMALMLCALVIAVERQNFLRGALFGLGVPLIADFLFGYFLKSPLPRSLFGF